VHELVFSRDGKLLASASADGTVRLWNGQTGQPLQTWSVGSVQYAVDLRPDGGQIAAGGFDGIVRIFDTKSARGLAQLLSLSDEQGHPLWLVLVPEGYLAASPSLLTQIQWRIQNQPIDPQLIQKALVLPERVRQSLSLQKVEPPFSK
jgi:WD40 repeat protein